MTDIVTLDMRDVPCRVYFTVPPEDQGQIIEVAYAGLGDGSVLRRITDQSDGSVSYDINELDPDDIDDTEPYVGEYGPPSVCRDWRPCPV